jgi:hypothetical protein
MSGLIFLRHREFRRGHRSVLNACSSSFFENLEIVNIFFHLVLFYVSILYEVSLWIINHLTSIQHPRAQTMMRQQPFNNLGFLLLTVALVLLSVTTTSALSTTSNNQGGAKVLIIGGTRFSGASLWKELYDRGCDVTVYNRGKTAPKPVMGHESQSDFEERLTAAAFLKGDRTDQQALKKLIDPDAYEYVYDMNAREVSDMEPLASLFVGSKSLKQYVLMSSAGVYLKSEEMPHLERDAVDPSSRRGQVDWKTPAIPRYRSVVFLSTHLHLWTRQLQSRGTVLFRTRRPKSRRVYSRTRPAFDGTRAREGFGRGHGQCHRSDQQDDRQSVQCAKHTGHYV